MKAATDKRTETSLDKRLLKVLLVEDEATDRISVERILRTCSSPVGFAVESVVTLSEAIRNLAEKKYDAVLLDLSLPDSSGIETVRQTVKAAPDIPVVVLTELEDEQTGFSALEDGATDYLVKDLPLDVVLVRTIVYALHRKKIQMQSLKLTHDINERMKELNCLYGISKLVETPGISLEDILEKTVCLIPAGWQYPGIACARIVFEGREYKTDNFKTSKWTQSADITLQGQKVGTVEVCYMKERPQSDEGPFPGEKRDLIDAIGERLGKIAERIKAEKTLRESEERYENLFKANIDGMLIADATTKKFRYANPAICRMLGYSEEELTQMGVANIHPKESLEQVIAEFEAQTSGAKITAKDLQCVRKDGQVISVSINAGTVMIDQTKYLLGIFRDVTESKKAEEALRESERKIHTIFDQTFQFIGLMTIDGILIEANRALLKFSDIEASSVLNKPFWLGPWWSHSPELQEKLRQAVGKAARGEFIRFEATHVAKDGMLHYVDFSLKPVKDETGKVIFLIPEGRDITEFKNKGKQDFS